MHGYVMPKKPPAAKTKRPTDIVKIDLSKKVAKKVAGSDTPEKKAGSTFGKAAPKKAAVKVASRGMSGQTIGSTGGAEGRSFKPKSATLRAIAEAREFTAAFKKRHGGA